MDRKWRVRIVSAPRADGGWFDGTIEAIEGKGWCRIRLDDGSSHRAEIRDVHQLKALRQIFRKSTDFGDNREPEKNSKT